MLTLLNVPKGTLLLGSGSTTAYDLSLAVFSSWPKPGELSPKSGILATHEGFLYESDGIFGQNPVEHLKLNGSIVDLSFSSGTSNLNASGKPSYAGVPWIKIPVNSAADGSGVPSYTYAQYVVPFGEYVSCTASRTVPAGRPYAGQLMALKMICGWCDVDTWFVATGSAAQWSARQGSGWNMNFTVSVTRINKERTKTGNAGGSYSTPWTLQVNPVYTDTATWSEAVVAKAKLLASTITTYGSNYPGSNARYTSSEPSGSPVLPNFDGLKEKMFPQDLNPVSWGDLAADCYSQIKTWDGNAAAYLRDSVLLVKAAKDTIALAKNIFVSKNPVQAAKSLASLFLTFRYGWCLQVKDTLSLLAIDYDRAYPHGLARRSSSRTYFRNGVPVTARCGVYFMPYSSKLTELEGFLRSVDFEFTLENLWDFVPLSFVVDWFTGLGDLFGRMDAMAQLDSFDVRLTGRSIKTAKSLPYQKTSGKTDWQGTIDATYYKRVYQTEPIQPSLISYRNPSQKFDHWLEGTSLIVQRL